MAHHKTHVYKTIPMEAKYVSPLSEKYFCNTSNITHNTNKNYVKVVEISLTKLFWHKEGGLVHSFPAKKNLAYHDTCATEQMFKK